MIRFRRSAVAWLGVFAVALHALWPLIAQARPAQAPLLVAACTVEGTIHYVALPAGKAPGGEHSPAQHCKLCAFGADRAFAPPPAALLALAPQASQERAPLPARAAFVASRCHPPAQPRAPPALS